MAFSHGGLFFSAGVAVVVVVVVAVAVVVVSARGGGASAAPRDPKHSSVVGVTTEFGVDFTETAVFVVDVDVAGATVHNNTLAFAFGGGSATIDGISTCDGPLGVFYWATDFEIPVVYRVDAAKRVLLAPLLIYADGGIAALAADPHGHTLYILSWKKGALAVDNAAFPLGPLRSVTPVVSGVTPAVLKATLSRDGKTLFVVHDAAPANASTCAYALRAIDTASGNVGPVVPLSGCEGLFVNSIAHEPSGNKLVGGAVLFGSNPPQYFWISADAVSGECTKHALTKIDVGDIVTCWDFDPAITTLYFATGRGNLGTVDISTGVFSLKLVSPKGTVLVDLAVRHQGPW